jgi:hypothetical protein
MDFWCGFPEFEAKLNANVLLFQISHQKIRSPLTLTTINTL